jgi:hypothetical protein
VHDFNRMVVARTPTGFSVRGTGDLRTLRLPQDQGIGLDWKASEGVAGSYPAPEGRYVSLTGAAAELVLAPSAAALPYLAEANARLTEFARDGKGLRFGFAGHVPLSFALANAQGCRLTWPADVRCCPIVRPLALTITVWNNMQSRRLSSTAAPERRRLMSHGQILGFGLVVAFALVAVYPGQALQWRIQSTTKADSLSLAYLLASLARPARGSLAASVGDAPPAGPWRPP